MALSNRFLEINGVLPVKPKPAPKLSNHFLEINGVYTPPPRPSPPPAPPNPPWVQAQNASTVLARSLIASQPRPATVTPPPPPRPAPTFATNFFLEMNGVYNPPRPPAPPVSRHFMEINGVLPKPAVVQPTPTQPTQDEIDKADARIAREIIAGRDADRLHLIDPRTGSEYTDKQIAHIAQDVETAEQARADIRIAREIVEGRDADRLHLINPSTGLEYSDAEIGEIATQIDNYNEQTQLQADARIAREIAAGRDADKMHLINPETGQEYTDAEIRDIADQVEAWDNFEQAQADARIAGEVAAGRDADKLHLINPATGQEYTDTEIGAITADVHEQQREAISPQFEEEVRKLEEDGTDRAVAEQLTAFAFVQAGLPKAALPEGIQTFDPMKVFEEDHDQFDTGRDVARGDNGRVDGFVSLEDLSSIIDNPDKFDPTIVATAIMIEDHISQPGNEELRENFVKKGWIDTILDSEWLDPNSDSIIVNLARLGSGVPPSSEFVARVAEDGPGELVKIGDSLIEIGRFASLPLDIAMTGHEVITADDPMAALRAAPMNHLEDRIAFAQGVGDWFVETGKLGIGVWALSNPVNAYVLERTTGVNVYEEVGYAAEGLARGFLTDPDELARTMVGYDMFIEDPIRWTGQQAPDIVIDLFTGGAGKIDNVLGAASDARRLGQQTLFDADNYLDIPGQQRLFDPDEYLVTPELRTPPVTPQIPGQLSLFDELPEPPLRLFDPDQPVDLVDPEWTAASPAAGGLPPTGNGGKPPSGPGSPDFDGIPDPNVEFLRLDPREITFNPLTNSEPRLFELETTPELGIQLKEQEVAINSMTANELMDAKAILIEAWKDWVDSGKGGSSTDALRDLDAQQAARDAYRDALRRVGFNEETIALEMKSVAATHQLDIIAAGDPSFVGIGNSRVNSSIGSQWSKGRADALFALATEMQEMGLGDLRMNVRLTVEGG